MEKLHPTKELIINTALKLFAKAGYEKTTISQIVIKTKLSKGAVYHHFKSKEEIANTAVEIIWSELQEKCEVIVKEKIPALEKLQKIMRAEEHIMDGKEKALLGIIINSHDMMLHHRIQVANQKYYLPMFAKIVTQGKKEGVFHVVDPLITTYLISSLQESLMLLPPKFVENSKKLKKYTDEYTKAITKLLGIDETKLKSNYKFN